MLEYSRFKYAIILVVLALSLLYALPNVYPQDPSVQITANRGATIDAAFRTKVDGALQAASLRPKKVTVQKDGNLLIRLSSPDEPTRASDALRDVVGSSRLAGPSWRQANAVGSRPAGWCELPDAGGPDHGIAEAL